MAEHNDGMKVSNLYIAQVKRKCGIEVGENFNLPKSDDSRQPQCPKEKEDAIVKALKAQDACILATKVATAYDGKRHNWIRDFFYFETIEEPDLIRATTKEVVQTKWLTIDEIKEMYDKGDCCLNMGDLFGFEANPIPADRYRSIIGQVVKGKIDRPMGSFHPRHKDLHYPVNYGYVSGLLGGDGAEQDIYLLGAKSAEQEFTGKVIAVYHRYDDNETKWIVVPCDDEGIVLEDVEISTDNEIYAQIAFQEQFFCGVLVK